MKSTQRKRRRGRQTSLIQRHSRLLGPLLIVVVVVSAVAGYKLLFGSQAAGSRSGLPWESGAAVEKTTTFESFRGRPMDVWSTWNTAGDWGAFEAVPTIAGNFQNPKWSGKMSMGMPLGVGKDRNSISQCATGAFDGHFTKAAQRMKDLGWGGAYIRLGWEMNGDWYESWSVFYGGAANWVSCYRHAHDAMKAVSSGFIFSWDPNKSSSRSINASDYYPGDAYVDIIGVDFYDGYPPYRNQSEWDADYNRTESGGPAGLGSWLAFAKAHNKKIAFPEWGIRADQAGDDAFYIQKMFEFFNTNRTHIAYENYFNLEGCNFQITGGCNPSGAAKYKALWGPNSPANGPAQVSTPRPGPVTPKPSKPTTRATMAPVPSAGTPLPSLADAGATPNPTPLKAVPSPSPSAKGVQILGVTLAGPLLIVVGILGFILIAALILVGIGLYHKRLADRAGSSHNQL